jgi:ribonuclease P protein component
MPVVPAVALVSQFEVNPRRGWDKLSSPAAFDEVFRARCSCQGAFVRILAKPTSYPRSKFGIAVSKKVCKTAVGRNYMKRIVRELLTEAVDNLRGLDLVILMKQRVTAVQFTDFRQEFLQHVNEIQKCRKSC